MARIESPDHRIPAGYSRGKESSHSTLERRACIGTMNNTAAAPLGPRSQKQNLGLKFLWYMIICKLGKTILVVHETMFRILMSSRLLSRKATILANARPVLEENVPKKPNINKTIEKLPCEVCDLALHALEFERPRGLPGGKEIRGHSAGDQGWEIRRHGNTYGKGVMARVKKASSEVAQW